MVFILRYINVLIIIIIIIIIKTDNEIIYKYNHGISLAFDLVITLSHYSTASTRLCHRQSLTNVRKQHVHNTLSKFIRCSSVQIINHLINYSSNQDRFIQCVKSWVHHRQTKLLPIFLSKLHCNRFKF